MQWQEDGDLIVLLVDMNDDVTSDLIQQFCQEINLMEEISDLYRQSPIPTHQSGSRAIDGIYVSRTFISNVEGGILQFGQVTHSNHQVVWLDIQADTVEMGQHDSMVQPLCH